MEKSKSTTNLNNPQHELVISKSALKQFEAEQVSPIQLEEKDLNQ